MRYLGIQIKHVKTSAVLNLSEKGTGPQKYDVYTWKTLEFLMYITLLLILILILYSNICCTTQHSKYENTNFAEDDKYNLINKSKLDTTKFTNTKLNARNVLEIAITHSAIDELINYYKTYIHVHLAYKNINVNSNRYEYKKNVGIVFGENFPHSTDILSNESPEVIFCITFGTDKMRDWKIHKTNCGHSRRALYASNSWIFTDILVILCLFFINELLPV